MGWRIVGAVLRRRTAWLGQQALLFGTKAEQATCGRPRSAGLERRGVRLRSLPPETPALLQAVLQMVRDESRHILALSEYRGPPSALSKGEPSTPLEWFPRRDQGQWEAVPALGKGEKVQQAREARGGGLGRPGALFGHRSGNGQQEAVGLPLAGLGPSHVPAHSRPRWGSRGLGWAWGPELDSAEAEAKHDPWPRAASKLWVWRAQWTGPRPGLPGREPQSRRRVGSCPCSPAPCAHVRVASLPAAGLPWTQGLVCPLPCLGGPCPVLPRGSCPGTGSLFQFQDLSDTCLDWREQFLQVVQEAFAKEREVLAAGLQPRLCGCDPAGPSALLQNLEKVAPEQVSLGLVPPSHRVSLGLPFKCGTTFSCLNSMQRKAVCLCAPHCSPVWN